MRYFVSSAVAFSVCFLLSVFSVQAHMNKNVIFPTKSDSDQPAVVAAQPREGVTLYFNGDIVTMEGDAPEYVEAVVEKDGKIVFVGTLEGAKSRFAEAKPFDLKGKSLFPGLIDGHAHFSFFGLMAFGAQLLPPPDAGGKDIPSLIQILKDWATPENIALTGWIYGMGFDDSVLAEKRFPTKEDLDKVSTEHPIMLVHISEHFSVVNSKGLEVLGITADTKDPPGGIIRRVPGTQEPNGVLEELAAIPNFGKGLTPQTPEGALKIFQAGQEMALSYGYTTAQEGRASINHEFLAEMAEAGHMKIDVVSYVDYTAADKHMGSKWYGRDYKKKYRIAGIKMVLDGSPQGRTAWRTTPYILPPKGRAKDYKGYPAIKHDQVVQAVYEKAFKNGWQVLTHTNGDAAMDQLIRAMKPNIEKYGNNGRRDVVIHGQYVRDDQLDTFKEMDLLVSLYTLHAFYWGDWHKEIIGEELGDQISPAGTALRKGLRLTTHTDAPVALPNLMRMVWISVNRTSRSGAVIGANNRLTPFQAMKSITEWSAYQHFEETTKGTLTAGKIADFVVLDKNPLKVPYSEIDKILVLKTIKDGVVVFERP